MAKQALKKKILEDQNGVCALSGEVLPIETELYDTDRKLPKAKGGIYTLKNTRVVSPKAHADRHGNSRDIPEHLQKLKEIVDDRRQVIKLLLKVENQIRAYKRQTDTLSKTTLEFLEEQVKMYKPEVAKRDKLLVEEMKNVVKKDKLGAIATKVKGVGPVTIAHMLVYVDLAGKRYIKNEQGNPVLDDNGNRIYTDVDLANHASCLWAYVGLDKPSHVRFTKGKSGGGNKTLRTALFNMAESQVKAKGPYAEVYYRTKERLENSEKLTKSRNTKGHLVEVAWKDTKPCHRHGAALRAVMKHFLADYWYVGRTLLGLEVGPLYPEAVLGGGHRTIMPEERGWDYR